MKPRGAVLLFLALLLIAAALGVRNIQLERALERQHSAEMRALEMLGRKVDDASLSAQDALEESKAVRKALSDQKGRAMPALRILAPKFQ